MKQTVFHGQDSYLPLQKQARMNEFEDFGRDFLSKENIDKTPQLISKQEKEIESLTRQIGYLSIIVKAFPLNKRNTGYREKIARLIDKLTLLQQKTGARECIFLNQPINH